MATISYHVKKLLAEYMLKDGSSFDMLPFKLHDFGARGCSSPLTAARGGAAHLLNFLGSDTLLAADVIENSYSGEAMDFIKTIPAAEHSTITSWGRNSEEEAYDHLINIYSRPGSVYAVVSDSYDIYNAVENLWGGSLREKVISSGGLLVVRPDSGKPTEVVLKVLDILASKFGYTVSPSGFKVLNHVRVIQGDGVNLHSIRDILDVMHANKYAVENIAFGMGGALLQKCDRDTLGFALKMSAIMRDGIWHSVSKNPVTDAAKRSKSGVVKVRIGDDGELKVFSNGDENLPSALPSALEVVYENGLTKNYSTFSTVKSRLASHFDKHVQSLKAKL